MHFPNFQEKDNVISSPSCSICRQNQFEKRIISFGDSLMKWHLLCSILTYFGAVHKKNTLELPWSQKNSLSLALLVELFRKIINGSIIGNYIDNSGIWILKL